MCHRNITAVSCPTRMHYRCTVTSLSAPRLRSAPTNGVSQLQQGVPAV